MEAHLSRIRFVGRISTQKKGHKATESPHHGRQDDTAFSGAMESSSDVARPVLSSSELSGKAHVRQQARHIEKPEGCTHLGLVLELFSLGPTVGPNTSAELHLT
jgi:hypothetical protein